MSKFYTDKHCEIHCGDCRDVLASMEPDSIESIVTDPPYGLSFMGKGWDKGVPGVPFWEAAIRVAKPGAHLLAFGGTRTFHRLAVAIEDAGWEIRDTIMWTYGGGFPKSLDVSKAIDKAAGVEREVISSGKPLKRMIPGADQNETGRWIKDNGREFIPTESALATDAAKEWDGWGTALKPAWEPIIVARKPLKEWAWVGGDPDCEHEVVPGKVTGKYRVCRCMASLRRRKLSVAENVQKYGTGALNIDGCRVEISDSDAEHITERVAGFNNTQSIGGNGKYSGGQIMDRKESYDASKGRFPANLIRDDSEEVLRLFPEQTSGGTPATRNSDKFGMAYGVFKGEESESGIGSSSGSAARFFYCAKASGDDRHSYNNHPTVKPVALMQYLVRLVTPPGGTVVDMFAGSCTTLVAAREEGFKSIGMELDEAHCEIGRRRLDQPLLF